MIECSSSVDGKCKMIGGDCTDTGQIPATRAAMKQEKPSKEKK